MTILSAALLLFLILDPLGNVTILETPLRQTTLVNAVAVALRARARQYELRDTLLELAAHRERLEDLVAAKAEELAASTASLHAAERLASLGTLADWRYRGVGPRFVKLGTKLVRYPRRAVAEWLAANTQQTRA